MSLLLGAWSLDRDRSIDESLAADARAAMRAQLGDVASGALFERSRAISSGGSPLALAAVACQGEQESAALLGLYLDRAGIPASVLSVGSLRIQAEGPPLDATPVALDRSPEDLSDIDTKQAKDIADNQGEIEGLLKKIARSLGER